MGARRAVLGRTAIIGACMPLARAIRFLSRPAGAMIATRPRKRRFRRIGEQTRATLASASGGESHDQRQRRTPEQAASPAQRAGAVHQGSVVREPERPGLAQRRSSSSRTINIQINVSANNLAENEFEVTLKIEGKAEDAGKMLFSVRAGLCRRVPHRERAAGEPASAGDDRMPAAAVPVRARDHRDRGAQRRLPAADARSGRFRRAVPPEHGAAGRRAGCPAPSRAERRGTGVRKRMHPKPDALVRDGVSVANSFQIALVAERGDEGPVGRALGLGDARRERHPRCRRGMSPMPRRARIAGLDARISCACRAPISSI